MPAIANEEQSNERGAGYSGTRDRMFLQDVLRHAGAARAAEFLGPAQENIEMDKKLGPRSRPPPPGTAPRARSWSAG